MRKYCKAFYLKDLRLYALWEEKSEESEIPLADDNIVYLWNDFTVVRSPVIPDTFERVFALIDPRQFEASFVQWVQGISQTVKGVIAIDGKTLRRSHNQVQEKKALHNNRGRLEAFT